MAKQNKKTILWIVLGIAVALLLFGVGTTVSNLSQNSGPLTPGTGTQTVPIETGSQISQPAPDVSTGTGMIRLRLYDAAGNLIPQSIYPRGALITGYNSGNNIVSIGFDIVLVNTGTVSLDLTTEMYGETAFKDAFAGKPGCTPATTARGSVIQCDLGALATGNTVTLSSNLVNVDDLVAARGSGNFVLNAYALAEFVHFGDARILEDSEELILAITPTPAPDAGFTIKINAG